MGRVSDLVSAAEDANKETFGGALVPILLGDFNLTPQHTAWDKFKAAGWRHAIPADVSTNLLGNEHYDDIWVRGN